MAEQIKVTGMVISSSPIGENDKRIVLLTKERGKISAFVRGARRPGNHLMAASDSFAFGSFFMIPGKESFTMVGADITNYFRELAMDVYKTYSAYYFLELGSRKETNCCINRTTEFRFHFTVYCSYAIFIECTALNIFICV